MRFRLLGIGIVLLGAACGGGTATDAGMDAGGDAGSGGDAAVDTGVRTDAGCVDADGDGHAAMSCGGDDCDDADPHRYPGNTEVCDATNHDEDCDPVTFGFRDVDMDGAADIACCNTDAAGTMHCGTDCNDTNTNVHPSQTETCNGVDDNCNGMIDEGVLVSYYADCDGDHYGAGTPMVRCTPPTAAPAACAAGAWVAVGGDCDDSMAGVSPGGTELCDRAGLDEDCNPATLGPDGDGDGAPATYCCDLQPGGTKLCGTDCNDGDAAIHAGATETCNGIDDDCNRMRDDGLTGCSATVPGTGTVPCPTFLCPVATNACCRGMSGSTMCGDFTGITCALGSALARCDGPEDCPGGVCCDSVPGDATCNGSCDTTMQFIGCHEDVDCAPSSVCVPEPGAAGRRGCQPV